LLENEAPALLRHAYESGRIDDTRTLYTLTRWHGKDPEAVEQLLRRDGAIQRSDLALLHTISASSPLPVEPVKRIKSPPMRALQVEWRGRRGWLHGQVPPSVDSVWIDFDGG
jgi:hypothetical protein